MIPAPLVFVATKAKVSNRGVPPNAFLATLVTWGRVADASIFAPNPNPADIYSLVKPILGPWQSAIHRRAVMLEVMRVHAGFESSWNWNEGVDITNQHSQTHIEGQETGIFQVSFDSTRLGRSMLDFAVAHGIDTPQKFIPAMKANHTLAMEYVARLYRVSIQWAGPIKRREILPWLSRSAVTEFEKLIL